MTRPTLLKKTNCPLDCLMFYPLLMQPKLYCVHSLTASGKKRLGQVDTFPEKTRGLVGMLG